MKTSMSPILGLLAAIALAKSSTATGQQHALVKDINTKALELSSSPSNYTTVGSTTYFTASTPIHGTELWKTDGTTAGTMLVKDIRIGTDSSDISFPTPVGGLLFFFANNGLNGRELWRSDGTEAGTFMVKDIRPGSVGSQNAGIAVLGGMAYFSADDGINGTEMWKSDGTAAGTMLIKDVNPGANSGAYGTPIIAGSMVYFTGGNAAAPGELWKTDGTEVNTALVKDIQPGAISSQIENLTAVGSTVFFTALDGMNARALWKSNGTTAGTVMVKAIATVNPGYSTFTAVGSNLYFIGYSSGVGSELWKSDGTAGGTIMVKDINPGVGDGVPPYATKLSVLGPNVYFFAYGGPGVFGVWKSDGTAAGTVQLATISETNQCAGVVMGGALYIPFGYRIWKTTGTAAGTASILPAAVNADTSSIAVLGSSVIYSAQGTAGIGTEPCKSNGTVGNAEYIKNISAATWSSSPSGLANAGGTVFFSADDGVNGRELWTSDGTANGTTLVKDAIPGSGGINPGPKLVVGNVVYFAASDGVNGRELWKSDGTAAGTGMIKDVRPGSASAMEDTSVPIGSLGNLLLFAANDGDGVHGRELWVTDGTETGTTMVKDINPGASSANPATTSAVRLGDAWYFSAVTNSNGNELWRSDGTSAGTYMVADIGPSYNGGLAGGSSTRPIGVVLGNRLYFAASDGANGFELWKTDGTAPGTVMVKNIAPNSGNGISGYHLSAIVVGNAFYFPASNGVNGTELWKSDGTTAGTVMVKNIDGSGSSALATTLTGVATDDTLFFTATDAANGLDLWKSDGTQTGTVLVRDIVAGSGSSGPASLVAWQNKIYFSASEGTGRELWQSDGTSAGTVVIPDAYIGPTAYSEPEELILSNGTVFFSAKQPGASTTDRELYSYVIPAAPSAITESASALSTYGATLSGTVSANNASTTVFFDYGPAGTFGSTIAATPGSISGTTPTPVSATLTGLLSGTTYSYRIRAVNSLDTIYSATGTFTTTPHVPGSAEPSFNAGVAGGEVMATAMQTDGKILIGGSFNTVGGVARNRIARLNADGTLDAGFNPNAGSNVNAMHLQTDGKILVGGNFATMGGATRNGLARLNADGSLDSGFNPDPNAGSLVNAIVAPLGGKVVFGGTFTSIGGVTRNRVARLNLDGTLDAGFNPDVNGEVRTLAVLPDGAVLLGGGFSQVGGLARNGFAKVDESGLRDASFAPLFNSGATVQCMAVQPDGKIVIGGAFSSIYAYGRNNLASVLSRK